MTQKIFEILYEHDDFVALSKPPNVAFHTEENEQGRDPGFVFLVKQQLGNESLYPVHRLDRVTSGVMLFAKNEQANKTLSKLFQDKRVEKTYVALSDRKPKKKQGLVSGDMAKSRNGSYILKRTYDNPAITRFKSFKQDDYWVFVLKPETGKTHQLRVACKSLGSPILGDDRYGGSNADRCYLHAATLHFDYMDEAILITAKSTYPLISHALELAASLN